MPPPILDVHSHLLPSLTGLTSSEAVAEALHQALDGACPGTRLVICTSGKDPLFDQRGAVGATRRVAEILALCPERLLGSVMVNPNHLEDALEAIELGVRELGMKVVGELVQYIHHWTTDGREVLPVVQKAIALDVPMNFHAAAEEEVEGVLHLAQAFPRGRFQLAHVGGRAWKLAIREIKKARLRNLWVEICIGPPDEVTHGTPEVIAAALAAAGSERVVFGSDIGITAPPAAPYAQEETLIATLESLRLSVREIEQVCSGNAREMLRI